MNQSKFEPEDNAALEELYQLWTTAGWPRDDLATFKREQVVELEQYGFISVSFADGEMKVNNSNGGVQKIRRSLGMEPLEMEPPLEPSESKFKWFVRGNSGWN